MNYKRISQIQFFVIAALLGIGVDHDSYNVFLAIASAVATYIVARAFFTSKIGRLLFFVPVSIIVCQLSVTAKKAVMDEGFKQVLQQKPLGAIFADVLYGFRHVAETVFGSIGAFSDALVYDQYSSIESLNYRFFTVAIAIVIIAFFILKEKRRTEESVPEEA